LIDLHTHTNESDGSLSPSELIQAARASRLDAIAITDHDTFAGYDLAAPYAEQERFELICGIELSTLWYRENGRKTVHLLGYFFDAPPSAEFRSWLKSLQDARRDRNIRLAESLQSKGVYVTVEEVQQLGRSMAGRPHFAKLMVQKGYVSTTQEAFDRYIGEEGEAFVERYGPEITDGIRRVLEAGGLPSLAHPVRLGVRSIEDEEAFIASLAGAGLRAIEVYHSDHGPAQVKRYLSLAHKYRLAITGGSDFHGDVKPNVKLGMMQVPTTILGSLRGRTGDGPRPVLSL
jgi:predicted metal-dependent phosphoesterase TrpH